MPASDGSDSQPHAADQRAQGIRAVNLISANIQNYKLNLYTLKTCRPTLLVMKVGENP